jgi:hypothetical protein
MALDIRAMARLHEGEAVSGRQLLCPGPGHSKRDRSLSVWLTSDASEGFLCHSFTGDDWRLCRDHVRNRVGLDSTRFSRQPPIQADPLLKGLTAQPEPAPFSAERRNRAIAVWRESGNSRGTPVETYLRARGLNLPDELAAGVLRFNPRTPWREHQIGGVVQVVPAMIGALRDIHTDAIVGVHRTRLSDAGQKLGRRMQGGAAGAAVKLDPDEAVTYGLVIGEGIETVMAARQIGFRPAWALGSAGAIGAFPVLNGIDGLTILAETGDGGANARAIEACGNRWADAGREVVVVDPKIGADINDALLAGRAA